MIEAPILMLTCSIKASHLRVHLMQEQSPYDLKFKNSTAHTSLSDDERLQKISI